jgi:hypothetical protein
MDEFIFPASIKRLRLWFDRKPPPARFFAKVFIRIEIVRHFKGKVLHQNGLTAKSWFIKRYGPDMVRRAIRFFSDLLLF